MSYKSYVEAMRVVAGLREDQLDEETIKKFEKERRLNKFEKSYRWGGGLRKGLVASVDGVSEFVRGERKVLDKHGSEFVGLIRNAVAAGIAGVLTFFSADKVEARVSKNMLRNDQMKGAVVTKVQQDSRRPLSPFGKGGLGLIAAAGALAMVAKKEGEGEDVGDKNVKNEEGDSVGLDSKVEVVAEDVNKKEVSEVSSTLLQVESGESSSKKTKEAVLNNDGTSEERKVNIGNVNKAGEATLMSSSIPKEHAKYAGIPIIDGNDTSRKDVTQPVFRNGKSKKESGVGINVNDGDVIPMKNFTSGFWKGFLGSIAAFGLFTGGWIGGAAKTRAEADQNLKNVREAFRVISEDSKASAEKEKKKEMEELEKSYKAKLEAMTLEKNEAVAKAKSDAEAACEAGKRNRKTGGAIDKWIPPVEKPRVEKSTKVNKKLEFEFLNIFIKDDAGYLGHVGANYSIKEFGELAKLKREGSKSGISNDVLDSQNVAVLNLKAQMEAVEAKNRENKLALDKVREIQLDLSNYFDKEITDLAKEIEAVFPTLFKGEKNSVLCNFSFGTGVGQNVDSNYKNVVYLNYLKVYEWINRKKVLEMKIKQMPVALKNDDSKHRVEATLKWSIGIKEDIDKLKVDGLECSRGESKSKFLNGKK